MYFSVLLCTQGGKRATLAAMPRLPDETQLTNVVILRSDNAAMKRIAASRERAATVQQIARQLIHFGVAHIGDVETWYRERAIGAAKPQPGDETSPD